MRLSCAAKESSNQSVRPKQRRSVGRWVVRMFKYHSMITVEVSRGRGDRYKTVFKREG